MAWKVTFHFNNNNNFSMNVPTEEGRDYLIQEIHAELSGTTKYNYISCEDIESKSLVIIASDKINMVSIQEIA